MDKQEKYYEKGEWRDRSERKFELNRIESMKSETTTKFVIKHDLAH